MYIIKEHIKTVITLSENTNLIKSDLSDKAQENKKRHKIQKKYCDKILIKLRRKF